MRELELKQTFDTIIAWNSIFHLEADEQKNMFHVFTSHLNDDGILLFTTGSKAGEILMNISNFSKHTVRIILSG